MSGNFIAKAIKHPGRVKNYAKRHGMSTPQAARRMARSKNKSEAAAGRLAERFERGGDLHRGRGKKNPRSVALSSLAHLGR